MNKTLRKAIIAGNWKMNNTPAQTTALINEMKPLVADADCEVVLCVPFVDVPAAVEAAKGSNIKIGAENVHFKDSGAFTGEVSADMLVELGVEYVVIGHSERRTYFGETDQTVNLRTLKALEKGLKPIICVGETLEQRELGYTETLLKYQTKMALTNVTADYVTSTENIKELLARQVSSSVCWQQSVEKMIADGVDTFIEMGPGKTLSGFMRKISRNVTMYNIENMADFEKVVAAVKGE